MAKEHLIVIDEDGNIQTLYDDCLHDLGVPLNVGRASNVEPGENGWDVVLTDDERNGAFKGYVVGRGYTRREDALDAEVAFINKNILAGGK